MSSAPSPSPVEPTTVLSILSRLVMAIARRRSYGDGHPMVVRADEALTAALTSYLATEPPLAIGVANRELLLDDVVLPASSTVVRDLAMRLHGMGIGVVKLHRGITVDAISQLVRLLARRLTDPSLQDPLPTIPGIMLGRIDYEQLWLADAETTRAESAQLWRDLAERMLGLVGDLDDGSDRASPMGLAATIANATTDEAVAQRAFDALDTLAHGVSLAPRAVRETIGERLQELLSAADQGAIVASLRVAGLAERARLVQNVVNVLPAAAVVSWLQSAATASGQDLLPPMLGLLSKMSGHFRGRRREAADEFLRETAADVVSGWKGEQPNPAVHATLLESLAQWPAREGTPAWASTSPFDPETLEAARLVQMACELDVVAPDTLVAVQKLADDGLTGVVLAWADHAQSDSTKRQLHHLTLTPTAISLTLLATPLDNVAAKALLDATNEDVVGVLIDALERCESRAGRRLIFDRLRTMHSSIADTVRARMAEPMPWFLARNLLALLRELLLATPSLVSTYAVAPLLLFQRHEHAAVRREAIRLLAAIPAVRAAALRQALDDYADDVQQAAIEVAFAQRNDELPADVAMRLLALADRETVPVELREKAVRAVGGTKHGEVRTWLIAHTTRRARLTGSVKMAPAAETVRAAVNVLASTFATDPTVVPVLALARKSGMVGGAR